MRIRNYLTFLLFAISIAPIVTIIAFSIWYFGGESADSLRENTQNTAKLTAVSINQFFAQRKMALEVASDLPEVRELLRQANQGADETHLSALRGKAAPVFKAMTDRQTISPEGNLNGNLVRRSSLVGRSGKIIASDDSRVVNRPSNLFKDMRTVPAYQYYVSNLMHDPNFIGGKNYFIIAVPIYVDGVFQGSIQSDIDMYYFDQMNGQKFYNNGWTMVVDGTGVIAGDHVKDNNGNSISHLNESIFQHGFYGNIWKEIDFHNIPNGFVDYWESGSEKVGYYTAVTGTDWVILSSIPKSELSAPIQKAGILYGVTIVVFTLIMIYFASRSARRFLIPIHDLLSAFSRVQQKDYTVRLPDDYKGEFSDIAASFNKLVQKVNQDTEELKVSEARYALIMEETNQVIFEWDIPQNHIYHTVHWTNKFGFSLAVENPGSQLPSISAVHPSDHPAITEFFREACAGIQPKPVDIRMKTIDSKYIWCTVSLKVIYDEQKRPFRAIGLITDTDHQKKIMQTLESRSKMDLLTQTYNKMTTEKMIENFLSTAPPEESHGFIIIDIDNFKGINDTLGHMFGDDVLKNVSTKLKDLFRLTDIVGRAGGDEFIILMKDLPGEDVLTARLRDICEVFRSSYTGGNAEYKVSASVGAAVFPTDGTTFSELYQHADKALYRAKRSGKDRFSLYRENRRKSSV